MFKSASCVFILLAASLAIGGCYSPSGGLFARSSGPQTYVSNENMQKTITMVDVRTNEIFFQIEIPPGKQLTFNFNPGEGDDPVHTPDLMLWDILDKGTGSGRLNNAMSVPNGPSRRIDVTLNRGIQFAEANPLHRPLRTDEANDRPSWWTPEGGPIPRDERTRMYDD